ncbi:MAG: heavy metal translocating P-type ATPase metal-binding domain-containing protein [Candidatus Electryonea clarkiae]|nr:heavy metal translocating P-type ATPase metal-binding domain-containing protein [Candidatus Electryonea clarkiae]MDP8287752.1 heavy metal translocating P-type ATPase metal-binding domain-containing protein [Candidatus Electryonea clarkiae]
MENFEQKNTEVAIPEISIDPKNDRKLICDHCGLECRDDSIRIGDKLFCCHGCKKVYELLHANEMCAYYNVTDQPGLTPKIDETDLRYGYLDDPEIQKQLLEFSDGDISKITLNIPSMHCASCIWLLEQLNRFNNGITHSRVNFLRKELTVTFRHNELSLRQLVELVASLGYEPAIKLEDVQKDKRSDDRKRLYLQIGIAGFAFGNIMLLSFPEYLARSGDTVNPTLRLLFTWINLALSLPVVFYSGWDYLSGAWKGLANKIINLDVPIALGIGALFARSVYEISFSVGAGYFDSLSGLIFLLLLGKLFQAKTYETLSFERDYTSYFPIAIIRKDDNGEKSVPVVTLKQGDRIIVRNQELIPADSILIEGTGGIDYSFVTGESQPVSKESGDVIYAGGRQIGEAIELEVIEEVSRSYLTRLWNHDSFGDADQPSAANLANSISKYFIAVVLLIAIAAFGWHAVSDFSLAFRVFTSVLIVACPCALALATPFTLGTAMRIMGQHNFYLKNVGIVEKLSQINHIVFDKTGTLTNAGDVEITWQGDRLADHENALIRSLIRHSTHPLSLQLFNHLPETLSLPVEGYNEITGRGVEGITAGTQIRIGSADFIIPGDSNGAKHDKQETDGVFIEIDGLFRGNFVLNTTLRPGVVKLLQRLKHKFNLSLLSGDTDRDEALLKPVFPDGSEMRFRQKPVDKLNYVNRQKDNNDRVLMIGDGLNDAGALKTSDVGIALTSDITSFSPACDALLDAGSLPLLDRFISFSKAGMRIIVAGFILSFLYNIIGLGFAVTGKLSPLISAVLMPLSSITVVTFASFATRIQAHLSGFKK